MTCGFSSTLTSDLTNRRFSLPFINLEDMAIKKTHTLCIRNDSSVYVHFTVVRKNRDKERSKEKKKKKKKLKWHGSG